MFHTVKVGLNLTYRCSKRRPWIWDGTRSMNVNGKTSNSDSKLNAATFTSSSSSESTKNSSTGSPSSSSINSSISSSPSPSPSLSPYSPPTHPALKSSTNTSTNPDDSPILKSIKNLPSEQDAKRSNFSKWFSSKMDSLQESVFIFSRTLNDVTGYSSIEALKHSIENQHKELKNCRIKIRAAKEKYSAAVDKRSDSQREVNELLQRKHQWSGEDLQRFTDLYRSDHENEHRVASTALEADEAERQLEECQQELTRLISARYREEQVWSDKIRRASTWGTWGLMGFNVVLFLLVQLGLEPWKRKRLVGSFEEKVYRALERTTEIQEERIKKLEEVIKGEEIGGISLNREGTSQVQDKRMVSTEDSTSDSSSTPQPTQSPSTLHWNNLYSRIRYGFHDSQTIPINSIELILTIGTGIIIGTVGTLTIIGFK